MRHPTDEQIAAMSARPGDDRSGWFVGVNVLCLLLGLIALGLRFMSRIKIGTRLGLDDWLVAFATLLLTGHVACLLVTVQYGMGKHVVFVSERKSFAVTMLTAQTFYTLGIGTVKLSILALYSRIFHRTTGWFTPTLYGTALFVFLYTIPQSFAYLFQCVPIDSLWNQYPSTMKVHCINFQAAIVAFGVINIVTDWFMLALPIPVVLSLKLEPRTKVTMCSLFFIGGFVCVVSIVRLFYSREAESVDPSWDFVPLSLISSLELSTGILAACMPTWRPLFRFVRSGITSYFTSTKGDSKDESQNPGSTFSLAYGNTAQVIRSHWSRRGRSRTRSQPRRADDATPTSSLPFKIDHNGMGTGMPKLKAMASTLVNKRSESSMSTASTEKILKNESTPVATGRPSLEDIELDTKSPPSSASSVMESPIYEEPAPAQPYQGHRQKSRKAPPLSYNNRHIRNNRMFDVLPSPDGFEPAQTQPHQPQKQPQRQRSLSLTRSSLSRNLSSRKSSLERERERGRSMMRVVSSDGFGRRVVSIGRGEEIGVGRVSEDGATPGGGGIQKDLGNWLGITEGIMVTRTVTTVCASGSDSDGEGDEAWREGHRRPVPM